MNEKQMILIGVLVVIFIAFLVIVNLLDSKSLNGIKSKRIGDGQHGTARWATKTEINRTFISLPFEPDLWRQGKNLPTVQGTVVGCRGSGKKTIALDFARSEAHSVKVRPPALPTIPPAELVPLTA